MQAEVHEEGGRVLQPVRVDGLELSQVADEPFDDAAVNHLLPDEAPEGRGEGVRLRDAQEEEEDLLQAELLQCGQDHFHRLFLPLCSQHKEAVNQGFH